MKKKSFTIYFLAATILPVTLIFSSNPYNGKYCAGWEFPDCNGGKNCGVCHDKVCTRVLGTCEDTTAFGGKSNCETRSLWTKKTIKYKQEYVPCPDGDALRNSIIALCGGLGSLAGSAAGGVSGGLSFGALAAYGCAKTTYCQIKDCETDCIEISTKEQDF